MMTQHNHRRPLLAFLLYVAALLSFPSPARAEDTDIFFINSVVATTRPNVLIVLDNTSNWSSTDTVAGDGSTRFENVRTALKNTVLGLDDRFNVGLMLFSETGAGNDNPDGGVIRAGVRQLTLDAADGTPGYRTKFANLVGNLNDFDKGNNAKVGLAFYEAYQYYANSTAYSGANKAKRDYANNFMPTGGNNANDNPQLVYSNAVWATAGNALASAGATQYFSPISDNCQKNFIIFISNGTTQENSADINTATNFLAAQGGDTTVVGLTPSGLQNNVSDEWAKFLATTDTVNFPGKPTVISYAVEVNPVPSGGNGPEWTAVMKSIGNLGKGKYFGVSSANAGAEIKAALDQIFAEVLAVNSVFASATLPVSVNVRGTFLNQVYMGVFRPDANASPRWTGNVKQYQLKPTGSAGSLVLVDTTGVAIENAATGFVRPSAISYWTKNESPGFWDLSYYPDVKAQAPLTASPSDSPDGEFVEKGGAAQHLRITYATDVSTRKLYTCLTGFCSTGDNLSAANDDFRFHTANANITDAMLGVTPAVALESLTRSGTTATATLTGHGFTSGQVVAIKNAVDGAYNGIYSIIVTGANTFTYPITESPAELATGTISASKGGTPVPILAMSRSTANDATSNTSMVTVTTAVPHGFSNGAVIQIANAVPTEYNGNWTITTLGPLTSAFTFNLTTTPVTPATLSSATATGTVITRVKGVDTPVSTVRDIDSVTRVGTTVTVTTSVNHGFDTGYPVTITGAGSPYDGSKSPITSTGNRTFTYTITTGDIGPSTTVTTLGSASSPSASLSGLSVSRIGTTATAVANTDPVAAGFVNGDLVTITGADQPEYNGSSVAISSVTTTGGGSGGSFQYTVAVTPPNSTTGATVEGGGVDRATLIDWIRGENKRLDDNPANDATAVRGYLHGDVLHSRPAVVNYNRSSQPADRDIAVFYGANDGIVHAVKGGSTVDDGYELWGFVPEDFFNRFARLYTATPKIVPGSTPRNYFGDGPISVDAHYVRDGSGVDRIEGTDADGIPAKVQLYIGMRRGGRFYYSLDVTDPDVPIYKWKISNTTQGFDELGQSWSDPKVVKIKVKYPNASDPATERKVLIFGAGYDPAALDSVTPGTANMGRGIFVVDAATGGLIWFGGPVAPASVPSGGTYKSVPGMTSAIPADVAIINSDFDVRDLMDRIYAADTGGNIWRVNIGDENPANWKVYQVASLAGVAAADKRRFLFAPDIVPFDGSWDSILVGSGDREQPFDTTIANRFYMIKDPHALNYFPPVDGSGNQDPTSIVTESDLKDLTTATVLTATDKTELAAASGWMVRLGAGEKVVTGATTLASTTIFATNTPASVVAPGQCTGSLGLALIYAVDFKDATPDIFGVVGGIATARASVRPGGGFPPTPVPVSVQIDGKTYEGAITGTQVINPPLSVIGQRYRVFWNLSIDN